jgi:ribosomal protein S18 acetylase RimI-like enzyme
MSEEVPSFRRAGAADAIAVRELTRAAYAKWIPVIGREPKPMGADYDVAVRDHLVDLLIDGGNLVGLIEMIPGDDHLLIENVAVRPDSQGNGLGRRLMLHAEQVAQELRLPEVRLYTNSRFEENIRFYISLGYAIDSRDQIADGFRVNMSKHLRFADA